MNTETEPSPKKKTDKITDNLTVSLEKCDIKKIEKSDEEPKPRIVLTIRSEKSNAKNSNMKVVSTEEKQEEFCPRRSSRTRGKWEWVCDSDTSTSPKKDKSASENDECDNLTTKRSTSRRNKDSDNVVANAIARKEKMYDIITPQRSTRRQKAKPVEEVAHETVDKGVRTRRSARPDPVEPDTKNKGKDAEQDVIEIGTDDDTLSQSSDMKLKHLCELGLKAINPEEEEDEDYVDGRDSEDMDDEEEEDDELDDDTEVITKLLEADEEEADSGSDEEYCCSTEASPSEQPRRVPRRRSTRRTKAHYTESNERSDRPKRKRIRSACAEDASDEEMQEVKAEPADAEEGSEAACPLEDSTVVAMCMCEEPSNVYAAPEDLTEPVFCQAIEMLDGVRVGCSHLARRDPDGAHAALLRAGPRAPYLLACTLHASQLTSHMCCAACGLFCTQGIFYQCSKNHLFHVECSLSTNDAQSAVGCPHCGVYSYRWLPANTDCHSVKLTMTCSNKRIFLPEQREQCTPAHLSFLSKTKEAKIEPIIPEDLLPSPPLDLELLSKRPVSAEDEEEALQELCDAILARENVNNLLTKIAAVCDVDRAVASEAGGSCVHAAARGGHAAALHALHAAAAALDRRDRRARTPLVVAVSALVDKSVKKIEDIKKDERDSTEEMEVDHEKDEENEKPEAEAEHSDGEEKATLGAVEREKPNDEDLMRVIRYLIAAGCDLNASDSEGMTALHIAAQHGDAAVCGALLSAGAEVDARDQGGWTPLVWAVENDHADVVRLLLREGADAMSVDKEGNSAVHWCAAAGSSRALPLLAAAAPAAAHAHNAHLDTPLHVAARQGHYSCVVILLARGAKTDVANSSGELPIDVATDPSRRAISLSMQMNLAVTEKLGQRNVLSFDISNGCEMYPIPCVNEVDSTPLPDDFVYVTSHVMPTQIPIDNTIQTMQGCTCKEGSCSSESCACCVLSVRRWARAGRLPPNFPHHDPPVLFECNATCACNKKKCTNNLVGKLSSRGATFVRTEVYRCAGGAGWGLRAREAVPRGAPLALYCGELLASAVADTRPTDHYMFSLDLKPDLLEQCADKTQLCIDAASYGSAARFMNHSCEASAAAVRVFTRHRDLRLPLVVLFATRDIHPGEPLTFDYGDKFWAIKAKWMRCECGAPDCRYPVKGGSNNDSN